MIGHEKWVRDAGADGSYQVLFLNRHASMTVNTLFAILQIHWEFKQVFADYSDVGIYWRHSKKFLLENARKVYSYIAVPIIGWFYESNRYWVNILERFQKGSLNFKSTRTIGPWKELEM